MWVHFGLASLVLFVVLAMLAKRGKAQRGEDGAVFTFWANLSYPFFFLFFWFMGRKRPRP